MKRGVMGIIIYALLAGTFFVPPVFAAEGDWILLDENQGSSFFYDKTSKSVPKPGIIRVVTRVIYTKEGKIEALKTLASPKPLETLAESRYLYDLDCKEAESRLLEVTHLDPKGVVLKKADLSRFTDWEVIPPEARMALVAELACRR